VSALVVRRSQFYRQNYYNIINILQQLSFITIMISVHHVFVMNTTLWYKTKCNSQIFFITLKSRGVDFTNMFTQSFYAQRSQKRKKTVKSSVSFALLGSPCIKAALKMLVKLTSYVPQRASVRTHL